jgi:tRNA-Thr(GGU) m(6)t(6)A37 methyltransferase TsaA
MTSAEQICMKPIGFVKTQAIGNEVKDKSLVSKIEINPDHLEALEGLNEFSHLFVLFWLHEIPIEKREIKKIHPRGRSDMPLLGVFATRTNLRPNPIGLTLVELLEIKDNILTVRGLDAFDRTPILDVKPFDFWDMEKDAKVPEWWKKLEKEKLN